MNRQQCQQVNKQNKKVKTNRQVYRKIIQKWLNTLQYLQQQDDDSYFITTFKTILIKQLKIPIIFDKTVYLVILQILTQQSYIRICIQSIAERSDQLIKISNILKKHKFISKGMHEHIQYMGGPNNSVQAKIANILQKSIQINGNEDKLLQIWKEYFQGYTHQFVWDRLILQNMSFLDRTQVIQLYHVYKPILSQTLQHNFMLKLTMIFQIQSLDKSTLLKYMLYQQQTQHQAYNQQLIQQQLQKIKNNIRQCITKKFQNISVKCQLFGSYRSGFYQIGSDFDITLFYTQGYKDCIAKQNQIFNTLYSYFTKFPKYVHKVQKITTAKVPLIKLQLHNKKVKQVDIVLNNQHGVQNSKFLLQYSSIPDIKTFGLLIKKWAKYNNLITIKKFSSYGVILMVLFYLIEKGKLNNAESYVFPVKNQNRRRYRQQKIKVIGNPKLKTAINLQKDFTEFLHFYSQKGYFFKNNLHVCLLKQPILQQQQYQGYGYDSCPKLHQRIKRYNYLINMHDPFNNSNPGRFTLEDKNQFFFAIQKTLNILKLDNTKFINQLFRQKIQTDD